MDRLDFRIGLSEDASTLVIEISVAGKVVGFAPLSASEADDLIAKLASNRAGMSERVPSDLDPGSRIASVVNPAWRIAPGPEGRALALRHPGYGWLGYFLPEAEARNMGRVLLEEPGE